MSEPPVVRGERGSTLIMALGAVTFIAITFSAILGYQTTGLRAQTVLADKRDAEAAADAGLDFGVAQLQADPSIGTTGMLCGTTTPVPLEPWPDPVADDVVVRCHTESGASSPRDVVLEAEADGFTATAYVTVYDPPDRTAGPSVVSISKWER